MKIFKTRYRIVRDSYLGFEAQFRPWWFPLWMQCFGCNTRTSLDASRKVAELHRNDNGVVEYLA